MSVDDLQAWSGPVCRGPSHWPELAAWNLDVEGRGRENRLGLGLSSDIHPPVLV